MRKPSLPLPEPRLFFVKPINHGFIGISNTLAPFMRLRSRMSRIPTNGERQDRHEQTGLEIDTSSRRQVHGGLMSSLARFALPANDLQKTRMNQREVTVETVFVAVSVAAIIALTLFSLGLSAYPLIVLWLI